MTNRLSKREIKNMQSEDKEDKEVSPVYVNEHCVNLLAALFEGAKEGHLVFVSVVGYHANGNMTCRFTPVDVPVNPFAIQGGMLTQLSMFTDNVAKPVITGQD